MWNFEDGILGECGFYWGYGYNGLDAVISMRENLWTVLVLFIDGIV